jgi:uncharacterized RDD family membrane protein YckC
MSAYLEHNNDQIGPLSLDEARRLIAAGKYRHSDRGWIDGMPEWRNIAEIPELAEALPQRVQIPEQPPVFAMQGEPLFATFWRRSAALLTDAMLLVAFTMAARIAFGLLGLFGLGTMPVNGLMRQIAEQALSFVGTPESLLGFLLVACYYGMFHASTMQATPGKWLLGLVVQSTSGRALNHSQSMLRELLRFIAAIPFGLTYWVQIFTAKRQALHDLGAGSVVVRKSPDAGLSSGLLVALHMTFVLFLLMLSVLSVF